jgi:hypothetical protein
MSVSICAFVPVKQSKLRTCTRHTLASPHASVRQYLCFCTSKASKVRTCTRHTEASPYASVAPSADSQALRTSPASTASAWLACKEESERREREKRAREESERRVSPGRYSSALAGERAARPQVLSVLAREGTQCAGKRARGTRVRRYSVCMLY